MGRPPHSGGPSFRFLANEVAEMEACLQESNLSVPGREVLEAFAEKFSASPDRAGKIIVQPKQVWNWFQNRRYAHKAKVKAPAKLNVSPLARDDPVPARTGAHSTNVPSGTDEGPRDGLDPIVSARSGSDNNNLMEFEAKSARDGAWYDVALFMAHRLFDTSEPEVRVRFAGFGSEEDEWVNVPKHVRHRSLPCEASECVAVLNGDLILCFQEGKDQALYYDAHVLDAQRRRHDVRGCRCRFLVRYVHDQSEEIVPLRKICRRPETDYRLQLLHAAIMDGKNPGSVQSVAGAPKDGGSLAEMTRRPCKLEANAEEEVVMMTPPPPYARELAAMETAISMTKAENMSDVNMGDAEVGDAALDGGATTSTDTGSGPGVDMEQQESDKVN